MKCVRAFLRQRFCGIALAGWVFGSRPGSEMGGKSSEGFVQVSSMRTGARFGGSLARKCQMGSSSDPTMAACQSADAANARPGIFPSIHSTRRSESAGSSEFSGARGPRKKSCTLERKSRQGDPQSTPRSRRGSRECEGSSTSGAVRSGAIGGLARWWSLRISLHHRLHKPGHYTGRGPHGLDAGALGGGCQGVERKNGVALFDLAGAFQAR